MTTIFDIINQALDRQIRTLRGQKGYWPNTNEEKKEYDDLINKHKEAKEWIKKIFNEGKI